MPESCRDRPARWRATAILFSIASTVGASPVQGPDSRDRLTASIEAILAEEGLVGATWALVTPEGTTVGAAGLNDALRRQPMSADDRVQVGSVAKTLVATGVLQLAARAARHDAQHLCVGEAGRSGRRPKARDGTRTLERTSPLSVWVPWVSAAAGVLELVYLLVAGAVRSVIALRRGARNNDLLLWPASCRVLLVVAPASISRSQPWRSGI